MRPANEVTTILRREFPKEAIKRRAGAGTRWFDYIEGHTIILRLIEATDNQFDVRVMSLNIGDPLVTATVELTIPGLGSRQHIGVQVFKRGSGEDLLKGAITDGLKKCATLFGVALDLYGEDYESAREPAEPPNQATKSVATTGPSTEAAEELGQRRRDEVRALADNYGWELARTTSWLRANRGMTRWSALTNDDLNALIGVMDSASEFAPPAEARQQVGQAPASDERDWIAEINAARSRAELATVANNLIKTVRDKEHPARVRLDARFRELDAQAKAVA